MRLFVVLVGVLVVVHAPRMALGQADSQFTGQVTDSTADVLPGVTVVASSEVLIGGNRVSVTDEAGRYLFIDLRPGTYTLTFRLASFSTVIREQLKLPAASMMSIDVEMTIGGAEVNVVGSGKIPIVDVKSTRQVKVFNRRMLDSIPTERSIQSIAQLVVGIKLNRPEVGLSTAAQETVMVTRGMSWKQVAISVDGQIGNGTDRDGGIQNYENHLANEAVSYETSGIRAETSVGGVRINVIPREGGNAFAGQLYAGFSNNALAADHTVVPAAKVSRVTSSEGNELFSDLNFAQGGSLVRDKFWFFSSARRLQVDKPITGSFFRDEKTKAPRYFNHNPVKLDGRDGRELLAGISASTIKSTLLRLTYQAKKNHRFSGYMDRVFKNQYGPRDSADDPGTSSSHHSLPIYYTGTAKWTATLSSRFLLEAGYSTNVENRRFEVLENMSAVGSSFQLRHTRPDMVPICASTPCYYTNEPSAIELQSGGSMHPWYQLVQRMDTEVYFRDRRNGSYIYESPKRFNYNVSMTYVTGSHNFKVGIMNSWGKHERSEVGNGDLWEQKYKNGVPYEVRVSNLPMSSSVGYQRDMGIYAQDTWTLNRLTFDFGVRFETMLGRNESTERVQSRFVPAAMYVGAERLPNWKDVAPRLGMAYDVFGDASTAVKLFWGRYNVANTTSFSRRFNPSASLAEARSWFDCALSQVNPNRCASRSELTYIGFDPAVAYGTSVTDRNETGIQAGMAGHEIHGGTNGDDYVQDWEIGRPRSVSFGQLSSIPTVDPAGLDRPWVSLMNAGVEREIMTGISVSASWYHRESYDPIIQYNRALSHNDWSPAVLTNPCAVSGSAPNGFPCSTRGIEAPATLAVYNLRPEALTRLPHNFITNSDVNSDVYRGFEVGFNVRLQHGGMFFGGWSMERNIMNRCDQPDDPNRMLFCDAAKHDIPWLHDFKLSAMVPLPYGIQLSGSAQFYPAQEMTIGGPTSLYGGNSQGGSTFDDIQSFLGNISYDVTMTDFARSGFVRTQLLTVPLMPPGSFFADSLTQIDLSVKKSFTFVNGIRWDVQADVYNVPNYFPILQLNSAFGTTMGNAKRTINRRFLQLATHMHW